MKNLDKKWLVAVVLIVAAGIFTIVRYFQTRSGNMHLFAGNTEVKVSAEPTQGSLEIDNSDDWGKELIAVSSAHSVHADIVTDNVWWQVRLDKNDARVYDLYPRNWTGNYKNIETAPAYTSQYRIRPGQSVSRGRIAYNRAWTQADELRIRAHTRTN